MHTIRNFGRLGTFEPERFGTNSEKRPRSHFKNEGTIVFFLDKFI